MTQDEIIDKLLFQAGAHFGGDGINYEEFDFREFAKLVAAKEREDCAEIAEKQRYAMFISLTSHPAQNGTAVGIANAIRARGEA